MGNKEAVDQGFATMISGENDIKPLHIEHRAGDFDKVTSDGTKTLGLDETKDAHRRAALGESASSMQALQALPAERYLPQDPMGFKQPGLQNGVYKKLRMGRYEVQAKLDLHGFRLEEALKASLNFVNESMQQQRRCVLISHGKGIKQDQPARLKNHLAVWLKHFPEVMAYHSALPNQGGTGCVYVLLRKSEQKKQENRERFMNIKNNR